ncbi:MAG: molecular chaperone DnaK suppressor DksA [Proteobacteria bacterium]|nr:MAG: molecular chaperone DnaK suppressor DksA [Pseudomonadota bacterium]
MRQSDLVFFKGLLSDRKKQIIKNIHDVSLEMESLSQSEANDEIDYASISIDKNIEQAITAQQSKELASIEFAIAKIEKGSYGVCEMCEEDIGFARLKVKPHAKYCIACREIIEKTSKK